MNQLCDDCDTVTTITIEPYGASKMAVIDCPNCGVSYDTNLDPTEVESHEHYWEASDIPGLCLCKCGGERYFNRFTQSYEIEEAK